MTMETTPAMRARIRELARPNMDDYDRCVIMLLDDFEQHHLLSHDDLCRLGRAFNEVGNLSLPQDHRINEWLKTQISRAVGG